MNTTQCIKTIDFPKSISTTKMNRLPVKATTMARYIRQAKNIIERGYMFIGQQACQGNLTPDQIEKIKKEPGDNTFTVTGIIV
jgi:hypothetical protein